MGDGAPTVVIATAPEWLVQLVATASPDGATILEVGEMGDKIAQMIADGWVELKTNYGRRQFRRPLLPGEEQVPDHAGAHLYPADQWWPEGRLAVFTTSMPADYWLQPGVYGSRVDPGGQFLEELTNWIAFHEPHEAIAYPPPLALPAIAEEFWAARSIFQHIRQAAYSRYTSAAAVLMVAMSRTGASVDHRLVIPPVIGSTQPVCVFLIILGVSGAGKSIANDVGAELVPFDILAPIADQVPIPTGEGMAASWVTYPRLTPPQGSHHWYADRFSTILTFT